MKRAIWMLAVLTLLIGGVRQAMAGPFTATLSAQPDPILEGGQTTLSLTVSYQPPAAQFQGSWYNWPYRYDYYTNGQGYISQVNGTLDTGNGSIPILAYPSGPAVANPSTSSYTFTSNPVTYSLPGTYTATVGANVYGTDNGYYNYYDDGFWGWYYVGSGSTYFTQSAYVTASTQVQVNNQAPTITQITWTPEVTVGQDFSFMTTASDPGLAGGETLSFAYDLNNTGQYAGFLQTGGTSDSGTYHFDNPGTHTVNVRVTDGSGGTTYGHFNVQVDPPPPPPSIAPEPSGLALLSIGCLCLGGFAWRRRNPVVVSVSRA